MRWEAVDLADLDENLSGRAIKHKIHKTADPEEPRARDKFGIRTNYLGSYNYFRWASYPRNHKETSKFTGEPCYHREVAIWGPKNIKRRIGVETFKDLMAFHSMQDNGDTSLQRYFDDENGKLQHAEIDYESIGMWLSDMTERDREPALNAGTRNRARYWQNSKFFEVAWEFLEEAEIELFSDLREYLIELRKVARRKIPKDRTDFEKRLIKLRGFNSFKAEVGRP